MSSEFKNNVDTYPFTLLREEADETDCYKNHTHENIADALSVLIETETGGLTIGIEGSWGGGKSTVLNILRRKLTRSYFFFFDAWAHEGDSLRRVFLESLYEYFKGEFQSENKTSKEFEALSKRIEGRRVVTTTTIRKPTWMGVLYVIAASFAASGMAVFSIDREMFKEGPVQPLFRWSLFWVSFALLSCPILLVVCRFCYLVRKFSRDLKLMPWSKSVMKRVLTVDNWTFLQGSSSESIERGVSEENERSSVEFERFFCEIVDKALGANEDKRLVIAIDNLDRINPEVAFILWSTLQTFLQKRSGFVGDGDWFKRLWILVPYDADGLSRLWNKDGTRPEIATSFMDKCFQIRIEVPRPIMSDWENFAKSKIMEALGEWPETDRDSVFDILRNTRAGILDIPTPREIKNYINQVAVIRNHAKSGISTAVISYYVLSRFQECHFEDEKENVGLEDGNEKVGNVKHKGAMSVEEVRTTLLWGRYPEFRHRAYLGENYTAMFAGLIFGVDADKGHELLLGSEIDESFRTRDGDRLRKMEGIHGDGFWNVFDNMLRWRNRNVGLDGYDKFHYHPMCV